MENATGAKSQALGKEGASDKNENRGSTPVSKSKYRSYSTEGPTYRSTASKNGWKKDGKRNCLYARVTGSVHFYELLFTSDPLSHSSSPRTVRGVQKALPRVEISATLLECHRSFDAFARPFGQPPPPPPTLSLALSGPFSSLHTLPDCLRNCLSPRKRTVSSDSTGRVEGSGIVLVSELRPPSNTAIFLFPFIWPLRGPYRNDRVGLKSRGTSSRGWPRTEYFGCTGRFRKRVANLGRSNRKGCFETKRKWDEGLQVA